MISKPLTPPGEPIDKVGALICIDVMGPQLPRGFVAGVPVERTDHHRVGHRHDGSLVPTPGSQPLIEGREGGPLGWAAA
jgi:hypothetical protein